MLAAVLAASYRSGLARAGRGALAALAGLTKFAPLALAPLLATDGLSGLSVARRARALALYAAAFVGTVALGVDPGAQPRLAAHDLRAHDRLPVQPRLAVLGLGAVRAGRGPSASCRAPPSRSPWRSPSIPRRPDVVGLAAACAAVILAVQLGIEHWFYLYIPWFFPLVIVALLGRLSGEGGTLMDPPPVAASAPARSSLRAAAVSS